MPTSKASRRGTKSAALAPAPDSGTTEVEEELQKWENKMGPKVGEAISKKNVGAETDYNRLLDKLKEEKRLRESNVEQYTKMCGAGSASGNYTVIGDDEAQISYETLLELNKRMHETISKTIDSLENGSDDDLKRLESYWATPPKTGSNHFKALKRRATKVLGTLSCSRSK